MSFNVLYICKFLLPTPEKIMGALLGAALKNGMGQNLFPSPQGND